MTNVSSLIGTWQADTGYCYSFNSVGATLLNFSAQAIWLPPGMNAENTAAVVGQPVPGSCRVQFQFASNNAIFSMTCTDFNVYLGVAFFGLNGPTPNFYGNGGAGNSLFVLLVVLLLLSLLLIAFTLVVSCSVQVYVSERGSV